MKEAPTKTRWWARVDVDGPVNERRPELGLCWLWLGEIDKDGPVFAVYDEETGKLRRERAYRAGYELIIGDIPPGHDLDHLCNFHDCVNPQHCEPVTRSENVRRQHEHRKWLRERVA